MLGGDRLAMWQACLFEHPLGFKKGEPIVLRLTGPKSSEPHPQDSSQDHGIDQLHLPRLFIQCLAIPVIKPKAGPVAYSGNIYTPDLNSLATTEESLRSGTKNGVTAKAWR